MVPALALAIAALQGALPPTAPAMIEAPGPSGPLQGTLLPPAGASCAPAPIVLIIPGSGPTHRDGDGPLGISGGVLRQLAEGLGEQGIAAEVTAVARVASNG